MYTICFEFSHSLTIDSGDEGLGPDKKKNVYEGNLSINSKEVSYQHNFKSFK